MNYNYVNIKQREKNAFGIVVNNIEMAKRIAIFDNNSEILFNKIFPGYFTLILKANDYAINNFAEKIFGFNNETKTIGIRMINSKICNNIINKTNYPLVATSANISGSPTPANFKNIETEIINNVDYIYKNDNIKTSEIGSTILDFSSYKKINIIRKGLGDISFLNIN